VNWYRQQLELPLVNQIGPLNQMASDHCACYAQHAAEYSATDMSPHDENSAWPPPCQGGLGQRAQAAGYAGGGVSEVMAFYNDPYKSVDGWVATLYHRLPLTSPGTKEIGYGHAQNCDTINSGGTGAGSQWEVAYPYDGQTNVDTCWLGYENPRPAPPPSGDYPSGPVITLQFGSGVTFTIEDSTIEDEKGNPVAHTLLTPKNDSWLAGGSALSLIPEEFQPATTYTVFLSGTVVNQPWDKTWSFTTAPAKQCQ
jgi:hypothetical protein